MAKNLKTTKYQNGDLIGTTTPSTLNISGESTPKYQWAYEGKESYVATYGRLYTWHAVTDNRNICPTGWHVPTNEEWTTLTNYLITNGYGYEGSGDDIAKAMSSRIGWKTSDIPGTPGNNQQSNNSSSFTAYPGGWRQSDGYYSDISTNALVWSSTDNANTYAHFVNISHSYSKVSVGFWPDGKKNGFSVRCVKDISTTIKEAEGFSTIRIYPNPVTGMLSIEFNNNHEDFIIFNLYDSQGRYLVKGKIILPVQQIDFSRFYPGFYILEFIKSSGETKRVKILKY